MQHHAVPPIPIQTIITSSMTPRNTGGIYAQVHTPAIGVETQSPIPHDTTLTTLWKLLLLLLSCLFEETTLNIPDQEAKRIENHVLTMLRLGKSNVM